MTLGLHHKVAMVVLGVAAPGRLARVMMRPFPQAMEGQLETPGQVERVEFPAPGGVRCRGWWVTPPGGAGGTGTAGGSSGRCVVISHGWTSHGLRMAGYVEPLLQAGCQVLLYNARNHGDSDRYPICTAAQFAEDALYAIRYAADRAGRPVTALGHSLGAAASLIAAADAAPAEAVIAIAAPSHPVTAIADMLRSEGLPERIGVRLVVRRVGPIIERAIGRSYASIAPEVRIAEIRCPVLLVHGSADEVVSVDHFHRLCQAAGPNVEHCLVNGATHDSVKWASLTMERMQDFMQRTGGVQ